MGIWGGKEKAGSDDFTRDEKISVLLGFNASCHRIAGWVCLGACIMRYVGFVESRLFGNYTFTAATRGK